MEHITIETVIIVGCVCVSIVIILAIILIVLCCQRRKTKKFYDKNPMPNDDVEQVQMELLGESRDTTPQQQPPPPHPPQQQQLLLKQQRKSSTLDNRASLDPSLNPNYNPIHPMLKDQAVHSSMLSMDDRHRKIIYEVIV